MKTLRIWMLAATMLAMALVPTLAMSDTAAATCIDGSESEGSGGNDTHYEHHISKNCVVYVNGTDACVLYEYKYDYVADSHGSKGWSGQKSESEHGLCSGWVGGAATDLSLVQ